MAYLGMDDPDLFREAVRGNVAWWSSATATRGGTELATFRPAGGGVTDTSRPGVRRTLSMELAIPDGLSDDEFFDLLSPTGTRLSVTTHVQLANRTVIDVPMGVFVVDSEKLAEDRGQLTVTAPDKWSLIQAARFIGPAASTPGITVTQQIVDLIQGALGVTEPVVVTATSEATVGALTWEKDRDKAILDLAKGIGAWVFFDRNGIATIADLPTMSRASADWLLDAAGVMTSLDRERSRSTTCNVVVISSSAADGESFPPIWVWDEAANSPTYAGPDPRNRPEKAGPFGVVTYYYDTPLPLTVAEAETAARTVLARVTGLVSQVSLGAAPNCAIDAFDSIDVLPPGWRNEVTGPTPAKGLPPMRRVSARTKERHLVDTVTHPLVPGGDQQIDGRSTAIDYLEALT